VGRLTRPCSLLNSDKVSGWRGYRRSRNWFCTGCRTPNRILHPTDELWRSSVREKHMDYRFVAALGGVAIGLVASAVVSATMSGE